MQVGDIVTFQQGSGLISHRIVILNSTAKTLVTKGDHNKFVDNPIPSEVIIGQAVAIVRYLGKSTNLLRSPLALLILVYLPSVTVILCEARSLQRSLVRPYRLAGRSTR